MRLGLNVSSTSILIALPNFEYTCIDGVHTRLLQRWNRNEQTIEVSVPTLPLDTKETDVASAMKEIMRRP
jgi:hypothetical protein